MYYCVCNIYVPKKKGLKHYIILYAFNKIIKDQYQ